MYGANIKIKENKKKNKVRLDECPFCGGEAVLHDKLGRVYKTNYMTRKNLLKREVRTRAECTVCKTTSDWYENAWICVEAWNTRVYQD